MQAALNGVERDAQRAGAGVRGATRDVERFGRGAVAAIAPIRALSFASGAFLGGVGIGAVIRAATGELAEATRVRATTVALLRSTGGAANVTARDIANLADAELRLTGVDDEVVASAANVLLTFRRVRNEIGEGNNIFDRAIRDGLDLAAVFGGDLQGEIVQLGKALEDPARGLTALRRRGIQFTADQERLIRSLIETGQTLRAQRLILDEVERQVGGTAAAVGRTLPGQLDVLKQRAANALGDYARRLTESEEGAEAAAFAATQLRLVWQALQPVGRLLGFSLGATARALGEIGDAEEAVIGFFRSGADEARGFRSALEVLNDALERGQRRREASAANEEQLSEARLDLLDATRQITQAEQALAETNAAPGALERRALEDQLTAAQLRRRDAAEAVRLAEFRAQRARAQVIESERQRANVAAETTRRIRDQVAALQEAASRRAGPLAPTGQLRDFVSQMATLQESGRQADRVVGGTLAAIARQLDQLPTEKQIEVVVRLAGQGRTARGILDELGLAAISTVEEMRIRNAQRLQALTGQEDRSLQEQRRALEALLRNEGDRLDVSSERLRNAREEAAAAADQTRSAREALAASRQALADAREARAETIRSAAAAISQAVGDAKRNLLSIADSVAEALGRIAGGEQQASPALVRRFRELRQQIVGGGGGPETARAAQQVAALAQAQQGPGADEDAVRRRLADLSDQLNRGGLTVAQFNRRLDALLRSVGFDRGAFRRQFGSAAANDLSDQIAALRRQAGLIGAGPQRAGGGGVAVVRPLEAVAQGQRDIRAANRQVRDEVRNVGEAQREISRRQLEQHRAQTRLQTRMAFYLERLNARDAARARLRSASGNRPKPQGSAGQSAAAAANVSAGRGETGR